MSYAENTTVSVGKSKGEIEDLLTRHRADRIAFASEDGRAVVWFELSQRRMQFTLSLPKLETFEKYKDRYGKGWIREPARARALWEQACRSQWRALRRADALRGTRRGCRRRDLRGLRREGCVGRGGGVP